MADSGKCHQDRMQSRRNPADNTSTVSKVRHRIKRVLFAILIDVHQIRHASYQYIVEGRQIAAFHADNSCWSLIKVRATHSMKYSQVMIFFLIFFLYWILGS